MSREELARRQAELVGALVAGDAVPAGFDPNRIRATEEALLRKRAGEVADRWPALRGQFGPQWSDAFAEWARGAGLPVVAVDNVDGSVPVDRADLPEACVLLFGQEGPGLSPEALAAATVVVEITQYGSTRSLNAASAAAVIMYEWCRRWA